MTRFGMTGTVICAFLALTYPIRADGGSAQGLPGKTVAEMALLQKEIDGVVAKLDADAWKDREAAEKALEKKLEKRPIALGYVAGVMKSTKNPETRFRLENALRTYYLKHLVSRKGRRGFIGLQLAPSSMGANSGIFILGVGTGFPGDKAGLKTGDIIVATDGKRFELDDFITYIASRKPGTRVRLELNRNGGIVAREVVLTSRPKDLSDPLENASLDSFFKMWLRDILKSPPEIRLGDGMG